MYTHIMDILKPRHQRPLLLLILFTTFFIITLIISDWRESIAERQQRHKVPDTADDDVIKKFLRSWSIEKTVSCRNRLLKSRKYVLKETRVYENIFIGTESQTIHCGQSITYVTNGDYTSLRNLETVAVRWKAPISFAIYSSELELNDTLDALQYVRNCLEHSDIIRSFVTFHLYVPSYMEPISDILDSPFSCIGLTNSLLSHKYNREPISNYLTDPLNMGRNIARKSVNTHFILSCDIELSPSLGIVDQFLNMVHRDKDMFATEPNHQHRRVYVLPVFQVRDKKLPDSKKELAELYENMQAHLINTESCPHCDMLTDYLTWLNYTSNNTEAMEIFNRQFRDESHKHWQPYYISNNREPFFVDRVTSLGRYNQRVQSFAMCLTGYEYYLMHPAFLVRHSSSPDPLPNGLEGEMDRLISASIIPEYIENYGLNEECKI